MGEMGHEEGRTMGGVGREMGGNRGDGGALSDSRMGSALSLGWDDGIMG